jgi:acetyl esterase/lipase
MKRGFLFAWLCLVAASFTAGAQEKPKGAPLPQGTTVLKDQVLGEHERQRIDLYLPKADKPLPVVLYVHGGGWEGGSKDSGGMALALLYRGFAVAACNYRLSKHAVYPAQIEDCKAAVRWLRGNAQKYNLDKDHIGAVGTSAGGHLVALLGTTADVPELEGKGPFPKESSRVQAVCDWFGPTDLAKMSPPGVETPITRLLGGSILEKKKVADLANPILFVDKKDAPFLILHGDKDPLVPVSQSEMLHEALKKAGVESELCVVAGAGHNAQVFNEENRKKFDAFFTKHLKPAR